MDIRTKYGIGDKVFYCTHEGYGQEKICESCGHKMAAPLGERQAVEAEVYLITVQVYGTIVDIWYDVEDLEIKERHTLLERYFFPTVE